ncbi:MAG: HlyD family secretion protein, partial [Rhodospirillaceae bacterium]|nr:HlyD family secretion protein [Rhodospirillaceae bacterium]
MGVVTKAETDVTAQTVVIPPLSQAVPAQPHRGRKTALALLASTALIGVIGFAADYWTSGRFEISTDDAYVAADSTAVAPKVSGYIKDVLVADNQTVKTGDVLARIDDSDFQTALLQAKANVAAAAADVANLKAQIEQQQQAIAAARSNISIDQANQVFAQQDFQRYADLVKTGYGTVQKVQQSQAAIAQATAAVQRDQAVLAGALKQSDVLKAQLIRAEAELDHDRALQQQAELNLGYTNIVAAVDGTVGARALRVGSYVQAGTQLMQIVPLHAVYVTANYKETQLTNVQPGQRVEVEVDTFPGVKIAGHVESLSPASGQEFALLPPDNATGNFTKIVQ